MIENLVRDNIKKLAPYQSAFDQFKGQVPTKLDANENPFGKYNRYPDGSHSELKRCWANLKNIKSENIIVGNGSDEIIDLIMRVFCKPGLDEIATLSPSFGMYKVCAQINGIKVIEWPLSKNFQPSWNIIKTDIINENLKLAFICSPNNPTGNLIDGSIIKRLIEEFKGIVVVDEAYIEFANAESWILNIEKYKNLIVLQTLSKAFGMANLRVGFGMANREIIDWLLKVKFPYNINGESQRLAVNLLNNNGGFKTEVKFLIKSRNQLANELGQLTIVEKVYPSDANFLLCKFKIDARTVYQKLIDSGVVVRNKSESIDNTLRITVGKIDENENLLKVLKSI